MIELVFVIVILGILAAVALPKFSATRDDATIAKGRSDISSIRSAIINERQTRIIKGDTSWIDKLEDDSSTELFSKVLMYPQKDAQTNGHWHKKDNNGHYTFYIKTIGCDFTYDNTTGKFTLDDNQDAICDNLVK
jgi:general secretion pathway protein G